MVKNVLKKVVMMKMMKMIMMMKTGWLLNMIKMINKTIQGYLDKKNISSFFIYLFLL